MSECTAFSTASGTVTKGGRIWVTGNRNKCKRVKACQACSHHSGSELEINKENKGAMCQHIWGEGKVELGGEFIALNAHVRKEGRSQISNLGFHFKKLEKSRPAWLSS